MLWCGWNRWRRKAPVWLGGKSHLCEHVCACHDDDDDKSYFCDSWDKTTWLQFVSAHLTPVGKSTEETPFISLNSEPKYQVQIGFCWFEHLWASTFLVTCDKIRQLFQSNPKQPTSGADEQWTMAPTFFLQVPWLLTPPKHQKTGIWTNVYRSKSVSKDISRLEFNPPDYYVCQNIGTVNTRIWRELDPVGSTVRYEIMKLCTGSV